MTSDNIIPVLAQVLSDDDTINAAAYGNITPGYPATLQDSKLTTTTPTALWLRKLDKTESGYIGSANSKEYYYDILIQIDVMSLTSQAVAEDLGRLAENLLKSTTNKAFNAETWLFSAYLHSHTCRYDDVLCAWVDVIRMRVNGEYVA